MTAVAALDQFDSVFGVRRGAERSQDRIDTSSPSEEAFIAARKLYSAIGAGDVAAPVAALRKHHDQLLCRRPILDEVARQLAGALVINSDSAVAKSRQLMVDLGLHYTTARQIAMSPNRKVHLFPGPDRARAYCGARRTDDWTALKRGAWMHPQNEKCAGCKSHQLSVSEASEPLNPFPFGESCYDHVKDEATDALASELKQTLAEDPDFGFERMRELAASTWTRACLAQFASCLRIQKDVATARLFNKTGAGPKREALNAECWQAILTDAAVAGSKPVGQARLQALMCSDGRCQH